MLATLMATAAITMLLMSKALAAPAGVTGSTYPTQSQLSQLINSMGGSLPAFGTITTNDLNKLLERYGYKAVINGSTCANVPKITVSPSATAAPTAAPTATQAPTVTPKPTVTPAPTATPVPTATSKPTATPAPTATPVPTSGSMSADEQKMINLVNQDRAANGLKPLVFDATLRLPALKHSQDMSQSSFFSHTSPNYGTFSQRLKASGVKYSSAGENIAMYGSVEAAEVGFMNSAGHRANILGDYTRIGIGIVYNQNKGVYYITQWFAK